MTLFTNIGQLVTPVSGDGDGGPGTGREFLIIESGGIAVDKGVIVKLGTSDEVVDWAMPGPPYQETDCDGRLMLPGFVDAHTHPVWGGHRLEDFEARANGASYEEIAWAGGGIQSTVRRTRAATHMELAERFSKSESWFLAGGTTFIEAKTGYGLDVETELRLLDAISPCRFDVVRTLLAAHAIPPEFEGRKDAYMDVVINEILPAAVGRVEFVDIFVEEGYFGHEDARRLASALGPPRHDASPAPRGLLGLRMHVDQLTNNGGAALAAEVGAKTADHLEQTDAAGIQALAHTWKNGEGTYPVLLPASVYALGKTKYPDARQMIDAGLPVVLATDFNPGSSPTTGMPMIMNLACTQMRMSPAEALTACTLNAACSLGVGDRLGSLQPGKHADFTIWNLADYRELICYFGINHLHETYIGGRRVWPLG